VSFVSSSLVLAWIAIVILALAMSGLLRQIRALTKQVRETRTRSSPLVGKVAPAVGDVPLDDEVAILVFASSNCDVCMDRLAELDSIVSADHSRRVRMLSLFSGSVNGLNFDAIEVMGEQQKAFEQFMVPITPYGVVINRRGVVSHAQPVGSEGAVHELIRRAKESQ